MASQVSEAMTSIGIGVLIATAGLALLVNFCGVSNKIFDSFASFLPTGRASAKIFRLVGAGWTLIGILWIITAVTEL
ncbi:hypothetical protein [Streptomyces sp. NPDC088864]|uniref:hypothetical protein n=1 Tax=Streptomyces sp. NPDC088864 TaxID=3365910 RepID=UPI0038117F4E